ncbi:MAG: DNA-3-methyladenine glycosylase 2 family protein [Gammaproteobacteria bacterium]|nr:DNA-3-methyladenine glycosylase 2 family protein [Gammaproteobacteria bacterium]
MEFSAHHRLQLSPEQCEQARRSRDPRFDGRFFVAVLSTGIYCRPVCPAPLADPANQRFHATAASAEAAGYRPCLRCRPERAPVPASETDLAGRALARIEQTATDGGGVEQLAADLGVSSRHLRRVLEARFGVGPQALIANHRLRVAKRLLDDTDASMTAVALAAGFASVRTFNAAVARCWQRNPTDLRHLARHRRWEQAPAVRLRLNTDGPFAHIALADFFARRAVPGLEQVADGRLHRRWQTAAGSGQVSIGFEAGGVDLELSGQGTLPLTDLLRRVRVLTDISADSRTIDSALARDPLLQPGVVALPGRRVPGMWDPFEGAVRAILGQQVSVAAARTLTARLLRLCEVTAPKHPSSCVDGNVPDASAGSTSSDTSKARVDPNSTRNAELRTFPEPDVVAAADLTNLGIPAARRRALQHLAASCAAGEVNFDAPVEHWRDMLLGLPGVGPWTVEYLCMRAGRDPDAFPAGDLVLRTRLGCGGRLASERAVRERAQAWRPWRAYAVLQLWAAQASSAVTRN